MPTHNNNFRLVFFIGAISLLAILTSTLAESPHLQTPTPVIYLADNLDEKDNLGWCIDTLGRGFAEELQVHSCKPTGGDVQFSYNDETLNIESVTYENKCVTIANEALYLAKDDSTSDESTESVDTTPLMLLDCVADDASQHFLYDDEALSFHPKNNLELCLSAGEASRSAGPYMSRDLEFDTCSETDALLWQWVILSDSE